MTSTRGANQREKLRSSDTRCPCFLVLAKFPRRLDDYKYSERSKDLDIITSDNCAVTRVHAFPFIQISPIFCQRLEDSVEREGKWELTLDIKPVDMPTILDLVYTGVCDVDISRIEDLLELSQKYKIAKLENLCAKYLAEQLDLDNAIMFYKITKRFLCKHVQKMFLSFITRNISDLIDNNTAKSLTVGEMMSVITDDKASIREIDLLKFLLDWFIDPQTEISDTEFSQILENVRFTKMSMEEYFLSLSFEEMEKFKGKDLRPASIDNGKRFHDPPVQTRNRAGRGGRRVRREKSRISRNLLVTIGGWASSPAGPCSLIESYNFLSNTWSMQTLESPGDRAYHCLEVLDDKVYLVGGYDASPTYHSTLWCLDLSSLQWIQLPSMRYRRCYVSTVLLDGNIVALGGHDGLERHNSVEMYDHRMMRWMELNSMMCPRSDFAVVNCDGKIYAIGGFSGQEVLSSIEIFDPKYGVWEQYSNMEYPRSGVKAVVLDGKIYVLGGYDGTRRLKSVECFTPGSVRPEHHHVPDMNKRRSNFGVSIMEGRIYVSGGYTDPSVSNCCEVYCPKENTWTELNNMNLDKSALSQVTLQTHLLDNKKWRL